MRIKVKVKSSNKENSKSHKTGLSSIKKTYMRIHYLKEDNQRNLKPTTRGNREKGKELQKIRKAIQHQ